MALTWPKNLADADTSTGANTSVTIGGDVGGSPETLKYFAIWGTFDGTTSVDLEISPDDGTSWISVETFTEAAIRRLDYPHNTAIRVNITAGGTFSIDAGII